MTTMDTQVDTQQPRHLVLKTEIGTRVGALQQRYLRNDSTAVATLARLRRGLGKEPGSVLDIVEFTYHPEFARGAASDDPTRAEIAAHHAMTLYALHQQSQSNRMHQPGLRLGTAVRRLIPASETNPSTHSIGRRFSALITADTLPELTHHLRGAVQLLRASGVPLDYAQFVTDLYFWQVPASRGKVRLGWARGFHTITKTETTDNTTDNDSEQGE